MAARTNPLPLVGVAPMAAMPGLISPVTSASGNAFVLSRNAFNVRYATAWTYSESNMRAVPGAGGAGTTAILLSPREIGVGSGKFVAEVELVTDSGTPIIGIRTGLSLPAASVALNGDASDCVIYQDGQKGQGGSAVAYGAAWVAGDKIGIILDVSAGTISFSVNGANQGVAFSGITGAFFPAIYGSGATVDYRVSTTLTYPIAGATQWR